MMSSKRYRGWIAMPILLAVMHLGFLWAQVYPAWQLRGAGDWVETTCSITDRTADESVYRGHHTWTAAIEYTWTIGTTVYTGDRLTFGPMTNAFAFSALDGKYAGARVPCFVDPHDPTNAVLARSANPDDKIFWVFLTFALGGILVLTWVLGRARPVLPWVEVGLRAALVVELVVLVLGARAEPVNAITVWTLSLLAALVSIWTLRRATTAWRGPQAPVATATAVITTSK